MDPKIIAATIGAIGAILAALIPLLKNYIKEKKHTAKNRVGKIEETPKSLFSGEETKRLLDAAFSPNVDKIANKLLTDITDIWDSHQNPIERLDFLKSYLHSEMVDASEGIESCTEKQKEYSRPGKKSENEALGSAVGIMSMGTIVSDLRKKKRALEATLQEIESFSPAQSDFDGLNKKIKHAITFYLKK